MLSHTLNAVSCGLRQPAGARGGGDAEGHVGVWGALRVAATLMDIVRWRRSRWRAGIICPAKPQVYLLPRTVGEMVDFMVANVLDLLGWSTGWVSGGRGGAEAVAASWRPTRVEYKLAMLECGFW